VTYDDAYSRCLRYGRAPEAEIHGFVNKAEEDGNSQEPNNHSDHVFADWLEDHDDPRHLVVRGDLHIRQQPGPHWQGKAHNDIAAKLGHNPSHGGVQYGYWTEIPLEDSDLRVQPIEHRETGKRFYSVGWDVPRAEGGTRDYHAHLDPEQLEQLLRGLDLPHQQSQFKMNPLA
jgi:hypothetical protein